MLYFFLINKISGLLNNNPKFITTANLLSIIKRINTLFSILLKLRYEDNNTTPIKTQDKFIIYSLKEFIKIGDKFLENFWSSKKIILNSDFKELRLN